MVRGASELRGVELCRSGRWRRKDRRSKTCVDPLLLVELCGGLTWVSWKR
jgi:hypothetical protein